MKIFTRLSMNGRRLGMILLLFATLVPIPLLALTASSSANSAPITAGYPIHPSGQQVDKINWDLVSLTSLVSKRDWWPMNWRAEDSSYALQSNGPSLSVQSNGQTITVISSEPSWKAKFEKSRGGALWDLRVPADSSESIVFNPDSPGVLHFDITHGAFNVSMVRESNNEKLFSSVPSSVSRFEVIEQTPTLVRLAIEGVSNSNGFTFAKVITLVPSGIRVDGELVPSDTVWHMNMVFHFAAGNLVKNGLQLRDDDSGPVSFTMNSVTDSGTPLPSGIDYPFNVVVPYKKNPSQSFKLHALEVPSALAQKRLWYAISWGEHDVGNGRFGVDFLGFTSGPGSVSERESGVKTPTYPAGEPLNYTYTFQIGETGQSFPSIPGPDDDVGDPPGFCRGFPATLSGTQGDDVIEGTPSRDVIVGLAGNDTIRGHQGDDIICGGDGDDHLFGNGGNDILEGGAGNDQINGGYDQDIVHGDDGNDWVAGGWGEDDGTDIVSGGSGHDVVFGGEGDDILWGGAGRDLVYGGPSGNDILYGNGSWDRLWGGSGNDRLLGGPARDFLFGEDGDDELNGGEDIDDCHGGSGINSLLNCE